MSPSEVSRSEESRSGYVGRFAPSPTGPLHEGSLVAALASWLDARAHGGRWLVRIEDVDGPRCPPGADLHILAQLAAVGLQPDEPPQWQSRQGPHYQAALDQLIAAGWAYACGCSRKDIALAQAARGDQRPRHGELIYPGSCRHGLAPTVSRTERAWRLRSTASLAADDSLRLDWQDRRLGAQTQDLSREVGDFVLRRADGLWAYQLAVVVDDARQGVTDVVRGEDLADNTPRQIRLQQLLGRPALRYLHTPLVLAADGQKLSKQNGAQALDLGDPLAALRLAAARLALDPVLQQAAGAGTSTLADWLAAAVLAWRARWVA